MSTRTLISDTELRRGPVRIAYRIVFLLSLVGFALVFLFPLYWMVTGGLKTPAELAQATPTWVPTTLHPENYSLAWASLRIAHFFGNTVGYAGGVLLTQLLVDVSAAYALSRLRPAFGKAVLGMMLASMMLPSTAMLVPLYLTVNDLGLLNTPFALWLPLSANAFNVFLLKRFFDELPKDVLDSANLDGAGPLRVLWHMVLPMSRPVLAVVSILSVVATWKDFLWPLLALSDPDKRTLNVALQQLAVQIPLSEVMAGLVIASVPMIVVFLVFQRHILSGLTAGSTKG